MGRAGKLKSYGGASRSARLAAVLSARSRAAKAVSRSSRARLTCSPTSRRISAGTLPMPRKRAVSSPFFPMNSARAFRKVSSSELASRSCPYRALSCSRPSAISLTAFDTLSNSRCRLAGQVGQLLEGRRIMHGQVGQNLAVQIDARILQSAHEARIGGAVVAAGSIDALNPQATKVALAQLAASVGVNPALVEAMQSLLKAVLAAAVKTLGLLDNSLV